jgi:hypothetical protein
MHEMLCAVKGNPMEEIRESATRDQNGLTISELLEIARNDESWEDDQETRTALIEALNTFVLKGN